MVAAISETPLTSSRTQQQQHHSEKDNGNIIPRRPKGRQVSSRYMSPSPSPSTTTTTTTTTSSSSSTTTTTSSSSRRFPSPLLSRSTNSTTPLVPKRSQSVDRRRPRPSTPVPEATKLLVTSTRSLSVSFQGEAFSLPISKSKAKTATPERRRVTPVTGKLDQGENSRPSDQHRWPARSRQPNQNNLSRSVDCCDDANEKKKKGVGKVVRALQQSMVIDSGGRRRVSFDGLSGLSLDLGKSSSQLNDEIETTTPLPSCDLNASDTDSVSSGSTSGAQDSHKAPRGIVVSARFWQETNSRLRRLQDPGSPLSTSPASSRIAFPSKNSQLKRYNSDGPMLSPRTVASPIRGNPRPASPSKLWASTASSPSRGSSSPSRVRSAVASSINSNSSNTPPSILSFSADVRRGKIGEDRIFDAHTLRLQYNRYVQWRFVNARADATFMVQKLNAERHLWNAWVSISELRHSVILKRIKLLLLRQKLKLTNILKGQV